MLRITEDTPITFQDKLPPSVDVVIIGGGVIGTRTAWYLRKAGYSVRKLAEQFESIPKIRVSRR